MVSIITILSLLKGAAKLTKKAFPKADLDMFIHEMDAALHSPAGMKLHADAIKERLNNVMTKLPETEQQALQDNINQSFASNDMSPLFDENGNMDIHFSDFLSQCEAFDDVSDLTESVSDVTESVSDTIDGATDITEDADSIWDFLSDLFA